MREERWLVPVATEIVADHDVTVLRKELRMG